MPSVCRAININLTFFTDLFIETAPSRKEIKTTGINTGDTTLKKIRIVYKNYCLYFIHNVCLKKL